ncbi:MAG: SCO family protein [Vicinamibacteria bacterium]
MKAASTVRALLAVSLFLPTATAARAQSRILDEIGIDQRLDAPLPLDAVFRDENGRSVTIGELLGDKPALLALVYYRCPMLCGEVLEGLAHALEVLPLQAGEDFRFIAVSFDPSEGPETAAAARARNPALDRRLGGYAGSRFLTGSRESIDSLTEAVGFRYVAGEDASQFAHASGLMVLTPEGRISRYLYGIEYAPRDLLLAILEASSSRIGSSVDRLLLYCYQYDPETGRYGLVIMRVLRLSGLATVAALGCFVGLALHRDRRTGRNAETQRRRDRE